MEDQPSARRMARYFLEEVDWEVLERPLDRRLLSQPEPAAKSNSGTIFGFPRAYVLAAGFAMVLVLLLIAYFALGSSTTPTTPSVSDDTRNIPAASHLSTGRHGRGKGQGFRNDSGRHGPSE